MDERIIRAKLDILHHRTVKQSGEIDGWQARAASFPVAGQYVYDDDWHAPGAESYWPAGKTLFLRAQASLPSEAPANDVYIEFEADHLEGLLTVNGQAYAGIDANHLRVVLPPGRDFLLEAEFVCVLRALSEPELRRQKARLGEIRFVWVDRALEAAYYDLLVAWDASKHIRDARRKELIHAALEEALLCLDLTVADEEFAEQAAQARVLLQQRIGAVGVDPEAGRIFLAGHTHIDTAWLWPLRETIRKTARTFSTACRLMERFPDFHFSCSQAQLYEYMRVYYPSLYEEIRGWVKTGRWECTGAMWVEADCNVPWGEALIRQVLYGVRFFEKEFGVHPRTCWLPDVFGYPASLPGILQGSGVDNFMTCKLHWQARNPFPDHIFWWEGIDGSRVLAHIPRLRDYYNGMPDADGLVFAWEHYFQKGIYPEVMLPFGYGDGGGGVTEGMLETAGRLEAFPGLPAARQGAEEEYFQDARQAQPDLPVWVGELYLETHRGTYTTQGATKRANRKNELALREAEFFGLLANAQGAGLNLDPLRDAWRNLLLLQFHDILPGSSIGEVYQEALVDHAAIAASAAQICQQAQSKLVSPAGADRLVVFNSLSWERADVASAVIDRPAGEQTPLQLIAADGSAVAAQEIIRQDSRRQDSRRQDSRVEIVFVPTRTPACGYSALRVSAGGRAPETSLVVSAERMENRFFILELSAEGTITRLFDKRAGREVVPPGAQANELQLFQDGPEREAAWNIHATYAKRRYAWDAQTTLTVEESGPVRARVRVQKTYRQSKIVQDILLYDQLARIDFETQCHWQERQVLLKAAFPLEVRSASATYEIQYGAAERPTHRNTSWEQEKFEVCAQRWADLSEGGYGVSLLNDCKYGYDVEGTVLRLTLLRGPEHPDPDADRGDHTFTYSLYPHLGDWRTGQTVRAAAGLNQPLSTLVGAANPVGAPADPSFFTVAGPAVLDALKPAEDGRGWILRFYEAEGGRGSVTLTMAQPFHKVTACNHIEEDQEAVSADAHGFRFFIKPFEVRTFRVE